MKNAFRLVVVGGVAAGASCAARARRLDEHAQITVLERGPDVSFANCGLPYHVGGEISARSALAVQTPAGLKSLLNLDVRTGCEALQIDRAARRVEVRYRADGRTEWLAYDKLMLAPGASPLRPELPGIDDDRIHTLRNLQDMDRILAAVETGRRAVVIGAGFIGIEMAEQLRHRGLEVELVELQPQILPQLDAPMTALLASALREHGVGLRTGTAVSAFLPTAAGLSCQLDSGEEIEADFVILSIGVQPETALARQAGLALGPRGHILVDAFMRSSDPDIYAAGDAVLTQDRVEGSGVSVPLGGPANRQGRVAADHMLLGERARPYPGSQGTAIVRGFDVVAGITGWSARRLQAAGVAHDSVTVNAEHHAGYYPGARPMTLKILWDPASGRLLGAQATGFEGVDKRLDVLATAIAGGMSVEDLCHLELAYAPPFGAAKDAVNLAGFAACNKRDGLVVHDNGLPQEASVQVLDVRPRALAEAFPVPGGAINIPFPELRGSLAKLDRSRPVLTVCAFGKMSYFAARLLAQEGFQVSSFSGGMRGNVDPRSPGRMPG